MSTLIRHIPPRLAFCACGLLLVASGPVAAQDIQGLLGRDAGIPEEFEDAVIDLVERYEQLRTILREQIQLNSDLFTQEEVDAALADLERELLVAGRENARLQRDYKAVVETLKRVRDEELAVKDELAKTQLALGAEIETLNQVVTEIEEENILQLGPTFSPSGRLGGVGIFNLPATNLGLLVSADYALRDRELTTFFGATFSVLPQRSIVEAYERLRARRRRRLDARAATIDEAPLDALRVPEDTGDETEGSTPDGSEADAPPSEG